MDPTKAQTLARLQQQHSQVSTSPEEQHLIFLERHKESHLKLYQILQHYNQTPVITSVADFEACYGNVRHVVAGLNEDERESIGFWLDYGGSLPAAKSKAGTSSTTGVFNGETKKRERM